MGLFFSFLILAIICFIYIKIYIKIQSKRNEFEAHTCSYNEKEQCLTLNQRSPDTASQISIKEEKIYNYKQNPSKLVYTGASVGGITTGGYHVEKAYDTLESIKKTGRYELRYRGYAIKKIKFKKEDFDGIIKKADKKFLEQFITEDNTMLLSYRKAPKYSKSDSQIISEALKSNNLALANSVMNQYAIQNMLTKEDCEKILEWLSGKL